MAEVILETERLVLRPPVPDDLPFILERMNTRSVMRHLGGEPRPKTDVEQGLTDDIAAFAKGDWQRFMICLRGGEPIGRSGLFTIRSEAAPEALRGQREIGWTLAKDHWGLGYACEAARAVLSYAFGDQGIAEIFAQTSDSNASSTKLMHRLGLRARPELGFHDPDYPPEDNPTTVWSMRAEEFDG